LAFGRQGVVGPEQALFDGVTNRALQLLIQRQVVVRVERFQQLGKR
jgi:hypothetical protein